MEISRISEDQKLMLLIGAILIAVIIACIYIEQTVVPAGDQESLDDFP